MSISRRSFLKGSLACGALGAAAATGLVAGCTAPEQPGKDGNAELREQAAAQAEPLPDAEPGSGDFRIDANINMDTIDEYLGLPGVEYTDLRMIHDPADYAAIGGDSDLTVVIEGFKVVPFPYVGTLQELPVDGAYEGPRLFDIGWEDGAVASATPRYEESMQILEDLFPRDKANFLMCGGAGYAHMMAELLIFLGWDPKKVYNLGGAWSYTGYRSVEFVRVDAEGQVHYYTWRTDIPLIDFDLLNPLEGA